MALKFLKRSSFKAAKYIFARNFDANFYINHYDDLYNIKSKSQALYHYTIFGKGEGRHPNQESYLKTLYEVDNNHNRDFDIVAYKFYNKDLVSRFSEDVEFILHYVNHGRKEGRKSNFEKGEENIENCRIHEKWKNVFSTSDFIAWLGDFQFSIPNNRNEAIDLFLSYGIDNLSPVNFEYAIDIDFLRENRLMEEHSHKSDADLYRAWLNEGFSQGIAPNERMFLYSYIGGLPFPIHFDWENFVKRVAIDVQSTRSQALINLFNLSPDNIIHNIDLMNDDAAWLLDYIGRRALVHGDYRKAVIMFTRANELTPMAEPLCLLGDAHRELGDSTKALEAYLASMRIEHGPIWAFLHAVTIYATRNQFTEAFDVLRQAHSKWRQKFEYGRKLHETIQLYFDHQSARAHALYGKLSDQNQKLENRRLADDIMKETLDRISDIYADMDILPAAVGGNCDGYISILANDDLRQCTHYRIEQKVFQFENAGIAVKVFSHSDVDGFIQSLMGARAAIFYRVAATPRIMRAIYYANAMNIYSYYEIDDLIFDSEFYPDSFASFEDQISMTEYGGLQFGVPLFRYAMSMCDASIASTPALLAQMKTVTRTDAGFVIRNGLDQRNDAVVLMGSSPIRSDDGKLRIFYGSGTKAHNADFNRLVGPALLEIMQQHANVDLVIVGHLKLSSQFDSMKSRIITYPFVNDVTNYWSILASCDINLAVLESSVVADCKSEIKWLEAGVLQVPSIVSATQTYREVIQHGIDGFLVDSTQAWRDALLALITKAELRAEMGRNARSKALKNYSLQAASRLLQKAFETSAPTPATQTRKIKVLICNVFFSPQSYGGATRVVEDNVQSLRKFNPDIEIGIFCSNEGSTIPGILMLEEENGIPVYRLSTPQEVNMDWRPFNSAHAEHFNAVIDHFNPDLIHFHCIQRLTATIVEIALQRSIPYFVTLHDAWWISDNQFLVDKDGLLQIPSKDVLTDCASSQNPLQSVARRQRLTSLLQHAENNLPVSGPFAEIYANAGVTKLRVIENGTPALEPVTHKRRTDGRVGLGHIGGRSAHKGASLIEAALRRGRYSNLHLTMVDGTLSTGQSVDTIWGTTPVRLIAPVGQSQVSQLYSQLDVLLAPSTWPESFGLVTREAIRSGLWVVASNLGAIGQDVESGVNGYVIDVSNTKELNNIFIEIDENPLNFINSPMPGKNIFRDMKDQSVDLYNLYSETYAKYSNCIKNK